MSKVTVITGGTSGIGRGIVAVSYTHLDVYKRQPYDKLKLDLFYIENYSFLLDIKLIFMTVKIFFQKEVSEGVDDRQVNALKDSGKNAGVSENKTEE